MTAIVGIRADSATPVADPMCQWQALLMDAVVLIVFIVLLVGIIAAVLMTAAAALNRSRTG
jgi:hypothetical protein